MLLAAVEEARSALQEALVRGVFSAGSDGLWLDLATGNGADGLLISADRDFPCVAHGTPRPPRARTLLPLVGAARRVLPGCRLKTLAHRGLERVLTFEFIPSFPAAGDAGAPGGGWHLIAELFGSHPNLVLVEATTRRILEALWHGPTKGGRSLKPGDIYEPPPTPSRPDPRLLHDADALRATLGASLAGSETAAAALHLGFAGLSDHWAREVITRAGEETPEALARSLADLLHRIESGPWEPHLLLDEAGDPVGVTPIRLRHFPADRQQPTTSLGAATERLASHLVAQRRLTEHQRALRQILHRLEDRLRARQVKLADASREFALAEEYRRMGEALVALQPEIPRGATEITLPDPADEVGATLTIPIDPAAPLAANVERLFKAARRGRRGALRVKARLAETAADLERVVAWSRRLAGDRALEEADRIRQELLGASGLLAPRDRALLTAGAPPEESADRAGARRSPSASAPAGKKREAGPAPRRFVSSDGFPILVGRDNEGNDYLTLHLARSDDLWLHVEGFPGSHVVVRTQNRTGGIPRRTLTEAAQLAVYYSQARTRGKVAVSYTLKKHVRKPRRSPPGLVTITQEKRIFVSSDKSVVGRLSASESND